MNNKELDINLLITNSDIRNLATIREFIYEYVMKKENSQFFAVQLALSVDEICSNLIKYSYNSNPRNLIRIKIQYLESKIIIEITDNGTAFNLKEYNSPSFEDYYSNFMKRGLGITIVKSIIDDISYLSTESFNRLTLVKYYK